VRSYGVVDIEYNIPNFIGWVYMNIWWRHKQVALIYPIDTRETRNRFSEWDKQGPSKTLF
jgi:hypothetical protein